MATSFVITGSAVAVAAVVEDLIEAVENAAGFEIVVEFEYFVAAINTGVFVGATLGPG